MLLQLHQTLTVHSENTSSSITGIANEHNIEAASFHLCKKKDPENSLVSGSWEQQQKKTASSFPTPQNLCSFLLNSEKRTEQCSEPTVISRVTFCFLGEFGQKTILIAW